MLEYLVCLGGLRFVYSRLLVALAKLLSNYQDWKDNKFVALFRRLLVTVQCLIHLCWQLVFLSGNTDSVKYFFNSFRMFRPSFCSYHEQRNVLFFAQPCVMFVEKEKELNLKLQWKLHSCIPVPTVPIKSIVIS